MKNRCHWHTYLVWMFHFLHKWKIILGKTFRKFVNAIFAMFILFIWDLLQLKCVVIPNISQEFESSAALLWRFSFYHFSIWEIIKSNKITIKMAGPRRKKVPTCQFFALQSLRQAVNTFIQKSTTENSCQILKFLKTSTSPSYYPIREMLSHLNETMVFRWDSNEVKFQIESNVVTSNQSISSPQKHGLS